MTRPAADIRFCTRMCKSYSVLRQFSLVTLAFCLTFVSLPNLAAQSVPQGSSRSRSTSNKALSPEEATGTSLRDFDAIRAVSSDFIENPDGGVMPVDEDDLWTPELSLGTKKTPTSQGVRVISYKDGKATSETRDLGIVPQEQKSTSKSVETSSQKKVASSKPYSASSIPTTTNVGKTSESAQKRSSVYASSNGILQTQSVVPAAVSGGGFDGYVASGFDNYSVDASASPLANDEVSTSTVSPIANVTSAPQALDVPTNAVPTSSVAPNLTAFPTGSAQVAQTQVGSVQANAAALVAARPDVGFESYNAVPPAPLPPEYQASELKISETIGSDEDELFRESFSATPQKKTSTYDEDDVEEEEIKKEEKAQERPREQALETAPLSENDLKNLIIEDVRISGLEMTTQEFNTYVKTRIGAKFSQQRLEEDKRSLMYTKQFIDVSVSTSWSPDKPDKVIVNFDLTSRRLMRYIKVVGCKKLSKKDILDELGFKPGVSRMDPYEVENGKLRIIELYKSKDYAEPHVEILRGDRPEDIGVVYIINEGVSQHVLKTSFVGNTMVSAARLRSLISVKPGFLYVFGGKFTRDRLDADVEKLLEYYRQLGYFDARIDREYRESAGFANLGKDNAWVSVRYVIDEGPRYRIRNFLFQGNRVLQTSDLEAKLKVKRGSYYNYREIEEDRIALRYKYQDLGYVRADITPNQVFTDEVGVVDIRYDISEDHRYRVRDIIVDYVGTESRTMSSVVLNMLDLSPGELLNGRKIRQSENSLRLSGYFNDKPSEGQLPEIAVVPDESKAFVTQSVGNTQVLKEARRTENADDKDSSDDKKGKSSTTRGQTKTRSPKITRGQEATTNPRYSGYVSYDELKKNTQGTANATDNTERQAFRSYGPSLVQNATNVHKASNVASNDVPSSVMSKPTPIAISPLRPFTSIIRGQTRQVPSGFSSTTTQGSPQSYGYQPYDPSSSDSSNSQYADGGNYANYSSSNLNGSGYSVGAYDENSTPGFADGVYSSIAQNATDPVSPETDEIYDGDVLVKIQEGRTALFTASIGVNSDYGLVGNVSFTERNFNLFRPPTSFWRADGWKDAFRGGGQIFNVQASPGTVVQSYRISWDVPYVFNTKNTFGITGLYGDHSFDEWFEARYGGEIRLGRQWTPRFGTLINAGIYNVEISDPAVPFCPDLNEALGTHPMYTLGLSGTYDVRNHPYTPSEGYYVKGTIEEVMGDFQFPRASIDGRYYKTLHQRIDGSGRWVLGLSTRAGWNGSDAPIYERYYGGGTSSLRGFDYRGVTPRYQQTGFGVGGNFEFYNTAELLVPVSGGDEFQLAFFVDSGTVAKNIKDWGRYRIAPGFGLRFSIPMLGPAPLALDFAFPINKDPEDDTEVFSFSMSGAR